MRHRPIGIGVQGLADLFILMGLPFESEEAQLLNKQLFETLYFGALEASCELAEKNGPYETYEGSPVSKGVSITEIKAQNMNFEGHCCIIEPTPAKISELWYSALFAVIRAERGFFLDLNLLVSQEKPAAPNTIF